MRIKKYVSVGLLLASLQWSAIAADVEWERDRPTMGFA